MTSRKERWGILSFFILLLALGVFFGYSGEVGLCINDNVNYIYDISCLNFYDSFAGPLFFGSISVIFVLIILFFVREQIYMFWRRFAIWAVPIGAFLIASAPDKSGDGFPIGFELTNRTLTFLFSFLFLIISLYIIISRSIRLRGGK